MISTINKIFSLNNTDLLVFVMEMDWVLCEVGSGVLYVKHINVAFRRTE
jgi:hypothetical protein